MNIAGAPAFNLDGVGKVEAVDDYTVKVSTAPGEDGKPQPLPQFLSSACNPSLGIQDSKLVKEHGGTDAADASDHRQGQGMAGPEFGRLRAFRADQMVAQGRNRTGRQQELLEGRSQVSIGWSSRTWQTPPPSCKCWNAAMRICSAAWTRPGRQAKANPDIAISVDQSLDENYLAMAYTCPDADQG